MEAIWLSGVGRRRAAGATIALAALAAALVFPAMARSLIVDPMIEQAKLTAPAGGASGEIGAGNFGNSIAVSSDGNTALVGAFADHGNVGGAWVFTRSGGAWTEQAKLTAPTSGPDKEVGPGDFGGSVALSADGSTALIGGNGDDGSLGAAWVFTRSGTTWSERKKLIAPTTGPDAEHGNGEVGFSVSLSAAGSTAFLGAPTDNAGGFLGTGAVFVFTGSGASWSEQAELVAGGTSFEPNVGHSVATSSDGNTVVAGGPFNAPTGVQGAAFVFTRTGTTWSGSTMLVAPPSGPLSESAAGASELGTSVAMSADGDTVLAGGPKDGAGGSRGAAWIFVRSGAGWPAVAKLTAPTGTETSGHFGSSLALSADAGTALIGGSTDASSVGAAWAFTGSGSTWAEETKLTAPAGTEIGAGAFGSSVALAPDAETALIGGNADAGGVGAAWAFVSPPTVSNVTPPSGPAGGGTAVTITGTGLNGASAVAFGSVPAASFSVVSPGQIDAVSPPGGAAPVDVTVTTPAGTSSTGINDRFTYFASDPGAPSGVHATAGNRQATISFTAPSSNGSGIIAYTVTAAPGGAHASGAGSPITVTGLSNGTRYTFTVTATNGIGTGPASLASNAVTPEPPPPSASHVSIKRVGKRKPKLAFTITAGKFGQPLKSIAVTLPKGLSFSKSKHNQSKGITVKGSNGKRARFSSKVSHGALTISLKSPGPTAQVVVASPELRVSRSFARKVKRKKAGEVTLGFKVSDKTHAITKITSKDKIS